LRRTVALRIVVVMVSRMTFVAVVRDGPSCPVGREKDVLTQSETFDEDAIGTDPLERDM
jgi:hypothetical protein